MDRTLELLVGLALGGLIVYLLVRGIQQRTGDGFNGNTISNSTVVIGGGTPLLPPAKRRSTAALTKAWSMPEAPQSFPSPLPDQTRTDGFTVGTTARPIVPSRSTRTSITVTNGSAGNLVRVGNKAEVTRGEGAVVPPHGVVTFPLREQTELWARSSGAAQVGVIVAAA